jgi:hypothetical protein
MTHQAPNGMRQHFAKVRSSSLCLADNLSDGDTSAQSMPDASLAKRHLAQATWFSRKEPIRDAPHVRSALPRLNQVTDVSDAERDLDADGTDLLRSLRDDIHRSDPASDMGTKDAVPYCGRHTEIAARVRGMMKKMSMRGHLQGDRQAARATMMDDMMHNPIPKPSRN